MATTHATARPPRTIAWDRITEHQLGDESVVLHNVLGHHNVQVHLRAKPEAEVRRMLDEAAQKEKLAATKHAIESRCVRRFGIACVGQLDRLVCSRDENVCAVHILIAAPPPPRQQVRGSP